MRINGIQCPRASKHYNVPFNHNHSNAELSTIPCDYFASMKALKIQIEQFKKIEIKLNDIIKLIRVVF